MDLDGNVTNVNYPNENYLDYLLKDKARPLVVNFKILHESDDVHIDDSGLINFNLPGEFEFRFIKERARL